MPKIQKVITECHDCEFCQKFKYVKDDYTTAYICNYEVEESEPQHEAFLLDLTESKGTSRLDIPKNCPLEDYKPTVS